MRSHFLIASTVAAALSVWTPGAFAQDSGAPPAHLSFVQGTVTIDHGSESEAAVVNMPIVEGDRIVTSPNGRAEVMFPDGGAIEIDPASDVEFIGASRVRVIAGAIEHRSAAAADPRSPSAQNLPPDLQTYAPDLDQNGAWQDDPQYGTVWYPTTIAADWRPYYDGYWYSAPQYGWTWVGDARWAWPTHHYGRWGYARNRWFWIPGRSYAAAWVSWGTAPDYVSWCPLGYDGRPVVALSMGYRSTWNAWTVVRRDHFGSRGYSPRRYAVDPYRLAANTAFIEHRTPPSRYPRGSFSVGSNGTQPRASTGVAVPRYGSRPDARGERSESVERRAPSGDSRVTTEGRRTPIGQPRATDDRRAMSRDRRPADTQPRMATPAVPMPTVRQPNDTDHPAYRPTYQPRYETREPQPSGTASPGYRDRRMSDDGARATARPAERAQPQPQSQRQDRPAPRANPPPAAPAPAHREGGESHARGRSGDSHQGGTAVRRPR